VIFYRGYFEDEWEHKLRECARATSDEDRARRLDEVRAWEAARANPLYHFSLIVQDVAETTETGEVAAIAYLLADAPIRLPRLTYRPRLRWGGNNPGTTLTLNVYDLGVEPEEVKRAYQSARSALLAGRILPRRDQGPRQRSRGISERTLQMLVFCRDRKATLSFPDIWTAWNAAHDDKSWRYKTYRSLYNAYLVAEKRWGVAPQAKKGPR
jgi:hypothetical protein